MMFRSGIAVTCLLLASAAAAETIYKYRGADGKTTYSNRLIPGAELIEAFEYKFTASAKPGASPAKAGTALDERINRHLAALDRAWTEVQEATKGLAAAEARLSVGVGPLEGEGGGLVGSAKPATPAVGGPQAPAAPAVGGPSSEASPAIGGPMGSRRPTGRNAEYRERLIALEADVRGARARLDTALRNYNQLR